MSDLIERLNAEADLQTEWDDWELNSGPAPAALNMDRTAELLREAAAELTRLREALITADSALTSLSVRLSNASRAASEAAQITYAAWDRSPPPGDKA